jgi:dethiobiotin synthetase
MPGRRIFVTGTSTGVGKTLISAILTRKLNADYWKPVQSGELDDSDTDKVRSLVASDTAVFHKEAYRLTQPLSPHYAARLDGVFIDPLKIKLPKTENDLIIEGAGGLMVPLNTDYLIIDLIKDLKAEAVLVSLNYLGSINHTLLSIEALKRRDIPIAGIIFNGEPAEESVKFIKNYTKVPCLGHIPQCGEPDSIFVHQCATLIDL